MTHNDIRHPKSNRDVTGVILAGGQSRRMGRDKATLVIEGRPIIDRLLDTFQELFPAVIIAGNRPDLTRPGVPCVADRFPGSALGGLHGALCAAGTPWICVVPCDLPFPDHRLIHALLDLRSGCEAVVPRTPAGCEPVFALYHRNTLAPMEEMLRAGCYRIGELLARLRVQYLDCLGLTGDWQRGLVNLNTPEDLATLMRDSVQRAQDPVLQGPVLAGGLFKGEGAEP